VCHHHERREYRDRGTPPSMRVHDSNVWLRRVRFLLAAVCWWCTGRGSKIKNIKFNTNGPDVGLGWLIMCCGTVARKPVRTSLVGSRDLGCFTNIEIIVSTRYDSSLQTTRLHRVRNATAKSVCVRPPLRSGGPVRTSKPNPQPQR
jgi:hypothetical protein